MKRIAILLISAVSLASAGANGAVLSAEQNGSQKTRYVVSVEGTNCWSRAVAEDGAPCRCESVPVVPPAGATLSPIGDQHLVLKDAAGTPLCYYHLVTDRWVRADDVKVRTGFGPVAWSVLAAYFLLMAGMAWRGTSCGRRRPPPTTSPAAAGYRGTSPE